MNLRSRRKCSARKLRPMRYEDFRTGLTFSDVRRMLWVDNPDPSTWRHKSRGVVLGYWRSLKLQMWDTYQRQTEGG